MTTQTEPASREIIGHWFVEGMISGRISIFREDGKLYSEYIFRDGSKLKRQAVEKKSSAGHRFEDAEGSRFGEYLLVGSDGILRTYDNDGLIATAKKIK